MGPGCTWEPFDLEEDDYWETVEYLEKLTKEDREARFHGPEIDGDIQQDHSSPDTDDYLTWLDSLVVRGKLPGPVSKRQMRRKSNKSVQTRPTSEPV